MTADLNLLRKMIRVLDLTSLNESDTESRILALCQKAITPLGAVAAACVLPAFVALAAKTLGETEVGVATVANFPSGNEVRGAVISQIKQALRAGADEIDVVFPYQTYLAGKEQEAVDYVRFCREACGEKSILKVILETGALSTPAVIRIASEAVIDAGADFIKTSTGKVTQGATIAAATEMLAAIQYAKSPRKVGIKISGGVRTLPQAKAYVDLVSHARGSEAVHPTMFRIGASQLLDEILMNR